MTESLAKSIGPGSRKFLAVSSLVLAIAYFATRTTYSPIVKTKSGLVQGYRAWSRDGKEFYKYLGIPFAKPPIGNLRFEPPQPPEKWTGVKYATSFGYPCAQLSLIAYFSFGSEDCLYLNVFVPKIADKHKPLPVLVWFYGGMFMEGMANFYGPDYLVDENVIVVTMSYRVGALGFLNTNDQHIRGNMGLKDQRESMRWVQRNIIAFGGNPKQVTIAGQSAGGASVHYHLLSKSSKGLFNRAISSSGSSLNPWAFMQKPYEQAIRFASQFCPTNDSAIMVNCLKQLPVGDILNAHMEATDLLRDPLSVFVPSAEAIDDGNAILTAHPLEYAKNGTINKVPWLTGVTAHEGLLFTAMTLSNQTLVDSAVNDWLYLLPRVMYITPNNAISTIIKEEYFGNETTISADGSKSTSQFANFTNVFSDRHFNRGVRDGAALHGKHAPTYLYYLDFPAKYSIVNFILAKGGIFHPVVDFARYIVTRLFKETLFGFNYQNNGTSHTDELFLLFSMGLPSQMFSVEEDQMSRRMCKMFATFASEENLDQMDFGGVHWPPMEVTGNQSQPLKYMRLNLEPELIDEPFRERIEFWNSLGIP